MNSRWSKLPYFTCALTLAQTAAAQLPAETPPPTDPAAEAAPPPPPPPEPEPAPAPPPPVTTPPPAPPPPVEEKPKLGAGTLELRIQTMTHVSSSPGTSAWTAPGFWYDLDAESWTLNLMGGVGYFLSPQLALGGDVGFVGNDDLSVITLAPFLKFVTGLEERAIGFVGEFSPGFVTIDTGDANGLALTLFAGAHIPIGSSAAFLVGAQVTRYEDFDDFGEGITGIGLRYGLSIYL
jgi:hypothetical protein